MILINILRFIGSVIAETREMQREALRRYPHLSFH